MKVSDIDKNLLIETTLPFKDIKYRNCEDSPFKIYGIFKENGVFKRMPAEASKKVNDGVYRFSSHTSGGRVRFKTNSSYVTIKSKMPEIARFPQFSLTGEAGFDCYIKTQDGQTYFNTFIPPFDMTDGYESFLRFGNSDLKEITINFPLYSSVSELYIGIQNSAELLPADDYKYQKPIVFYGSSITHGCSASRPGNSYPAMISRRLDIDFINLGFSGSAKGEDAMTDYIKNLDMSVFVLDYDYNAPNNEHFEATHEKMFKGIRQANPNLPIIMLPRPRFVPGSESLKRYEIIKTTYENALNSGDKNVYMFDGKTLMALAENNGTVDDCHPNDLGFYSIATALESLLKNILK